MPEISPPPPIDKNPASKRIAFLVIHGIGQQRPYETLDQFGRGLLESFASDKNAPAWKIYPQLEICRDPNHAQQSWVRASYRIAPDTPVVFQSDLHTPGETIEDISLIEYYWAPITQDKITYSGSLLFLVRAGLQPFLYMGANINAIGKTDPGRLWKVIGREFIRQACLFLPLILFLAVTLAWLDAVKPLTTIKAIRNPLPSAILTALTAVLIFIRYLYTYTTGKALFQSLMAKSGWQTKSPWRLLMFFAFLGNLFLWPFLLSPVLRFIASFGAHIASSMPWISLHLGHWSTGLRTVAAHTAFPANNADWMTRLHAILFLDPSFSVYLPIILWLVLAAFVRFILINYVGDVAVYVNASELAKNFGARSEILDECTATLTGILKEKLRPADPLSPLAFDQVYVAGHSLGSVIAYDTINTLLNRARTASADPAQIQTADLDRLRGMVTFGSPLNKIFYFFREQIDPRQVLRSQTLDLLHGFRVLSNLKQPGGDWQFQPVIDDDWRQAEYYLDHNFRWINAYSIEDPVSGRLIFYNLQDELNQEQYNLYPPVIAHLSYWKDPNFYNFVRKRLL
jgi:hypothetical protein